jgi:hypothetical protein
MKEYNMKIEDYQREKEEIEERLENLYNRKIELFLEDFIRNVNPILENMKNKNNSISKIIEKIKIMEE